MQRIIINESDITTNTTENFSTDIVYIPGFSTNDSLEAFVPTLCTSLAEFTLNIGDTAPVFESDQEYPVAGSASSTTYGFPSRAIPTSGTSEATTIMYKKGTVDPAYTMAKELVNAGIPILFEKVNGGSYTEGEETKTFGINVEDMYKALRTKIFTTDVIDSTTEPLSNVLKKDYDLKYITSGGYPVYEYGITGTSGEAGQVISTAMINIACKRGDAIALIDHTNNPARALIGTGSVYSVVNSEKFAQADNMDTFASMYTPWAKYSLLCTYSNTIWTSSGQSVLTSSIMPGSYAYLLSLAKSIKTNPNWLSISGVSRGYVPNLQSLNTNNLLTNSIADAYQPDDSSTQSSRICINAITNINGYGYCIWGNKTLRDNTNSSRTGFATRFMNLRSLLCDVKKQARSAALALMFEQNNDTLWANFKAKVTPLLDSMVSGAGLSSYKIIKNTTTDKTKLACTIKLYPIYAVESFEINIAMTDDEVSVD